MDIYRLGRGHEEEHVLLNKIVPAMQVRHVEVVLLQEEHGD